MCVRVRVRAQVRSLRLEQQVEKNRILSEALQTLATEHHQLEQSVVGGPPPPSEDEFHDAVSGECGAVLGGRGEAGGHRGEGLPLTPLSCSAPPPSPPSSTPQDYGILFCAPEA